MSKELNMLEVAVDTIEITEEIVKLDDLSLALIGGGEAIVAY